MGGGGDFTGNADKMEDEKWATRARHHEPRRRRRRPF